MPVPVTTMLNCFSADFGGVKLSATLTVKLEVPVAVGLPEMVPELLKLRPAGRLPEETDQVYGVLPPVAARLVE